MGSGESVNKTTEDNNNNKLRPEIVPLQHTTICHNKASEQYLPVKMTYETGTWEGWVPVVYRRTGLELTTPREINGYLNKIYPYLDPSKFDLWRKEQEKMWENNNGEVTKAIFLGLLKGGWQCSHCLYPETNNPARRFQDIKEKGYTIATDTSKYCPVCKKTTMHLMLLPLPLGNINGNGYESWSPKLRKRILKVLDNKDAYEGKKVTSSLLPDHKFSEIRWDEKTKEENPDSMTDEEIKNKFQLLTNQRNQEKREVCRECYQTNRRGTIYGIMYFYEGTEVWDESIPKKGKEAEKGCIGCPWYDIDAWRKNVQKKLSE